MSKCLYPEKLIPIREYIGTDQCEQASTQRYYYGTWTVYSTRYSGTEQGGIYWNGEVWTILLPGEDILERSSMEEVANLLLG